MIAAICCTGSTTHGGKGIDGGKRFMLVDELLDRGIYFALRTGLVSR